MPPDPFRVVIDTNTLLRGLVSDPSSAAAKTVALAESRSFIPLLSKPVWDEYRAVTRDRKIVSRFPRLAKWDVELTLRRLRFISDYIRDPGVRFQYDRDPRDQCFVELAIAQDATHIVSSDRDLLDLPTSRGDAGRRFRQRLPSVKVLDPAGFIGIIELHGK